MPGDEPWRSSMPASSLTAISRARAGQPAIIRLMTPGPAVATLGGQASGSADRQSGPGQPP